jgi:hypothetical protein
MLLAVGAVACGNDVEHDPQRLVASGQLVTESGTPLADVSVDRYRLTFVVAGEAGEVPIERVFTTDAHGAPIASDVDGRFEVRSEDLALSYQWQRDELECQDVCVAWEEVCEQASEEVCLDICTELECWEDCTTECWEETVCDEFGECWLETVCEDSCSEVCEPVSYECNCHVEVYEVCGDECIETVEECAWVTRTYTSDASLGAVVRTHADITLSSQEIVEADVLEAYRHVACDEDGECSTTNLWIEKDRFVPPAAD